MTEVKLVKYITLIYEDYTFLVWGCSIALEADIQRTEISLIMAVFQHRFTTSRVLLLCLLGLSHDLLAQLNKAEDTTTLFIIYLKYIIILSHMLTVCGIDCHSFKSSCPVHLVHFNRTFCCTSVQQKKTVIKRK